MCTKILLFVTRLVDCRRKGQVLRVTSLEFMASTRSAIRTLRRRQCVCFHSRINWIRRVHLGQSVDIMLGIDEMINPEGAKHKNTTGNSRDDQIDHGNLSNVSKFMCTEDGILFSHFFFGTHISIRGPVTSSY
jgi:hypothetical protein